MALKIARICKTVVNLYFNSSTKSRGRLCRSFAPPASRPWEQAFTLVEVSVVMLLLTVLMIASYGALFSMDLCTRRGADYIAAMTVVEAKIMDIQNATYNPPNNDFNSSTNYVTNTDSISLDQVGTTLRVNGTIISRIEPVAAGHLVTVTGTFHEPRGDLTVSQQTVVNRFSGGQQ